jgi:5-methylcytosine-specific restriction endonuclease McrA
VPWDNSPEKRARDKATYQDPEYVRNRALALRRAGGRCEKCGRSGRRLQVDHITPVAAGGTHALANLQVLCSGPGSCHAVKSAGEGGGYRKPKANPQPLRRTSWRPDQGLNVGADH